MGKQASSPVILAVVLVVSVALCGCGGAERQGSAATLPRGEPRSITTTLYFLTADRAAPLGVRRSILRRSPYAREALEALLAGPTELERQRGVATAIPPGTTLLSLRIEDLTAAVADLSGLTRSEMDGVARVRVITQITRTLVGLSGIERVSLRNDGRRWGLWRMDGGVSDGPYDYEALLGFTGVCTSRPGTEAVAGDCFAALP